MTALPSPRPNSRLSRHTLDSHALRQYQQGIQAWHTPAVFSLDYKTAACPDTETFEQLIRNETERYSQQLQNYGWAFRALEQRPIRTAPYVPKSQHLAELQLSL